jgi:hypothetical protein
MNLKASLLCVLLAALTLLVNGCARSQPARGAVATPAPASRSGAKLDQLNADLATVSDQTHSQATGATQELPNQVSPADPQKNSSLPFVPAPRR